MAGEIISQVTGPGIPLRGNDIDTDRIIPARFLKCVTFDGIGEHAFADDIKGLAAKDETHPFADARFATALSLSPTRTLAAAPAASTPHNPSSAGASAPSSPRATAKFSWQLRLPGRPVLHRRPRHLRQAAGRHRSRSRRRTFHRRCRCHHHRRRRNHFIGNPTRRPRPIP